MIEQTALLDTPHAAKRVPSAEALWAALPASFVEDYLSATRSSEHFAEDDVEARRTLLLAMACTMDAFPDATLRQAACWAWVALTGPALIFPQELAGWREVFGDTAAGAWVWAAAGLAPAEAAHASREQAEVLAALRGAAMPPL